MKDGITEIPGNDATGFEEKCARMLCVEEGHDPMEVVAYDWTAPDDRRWKLEQLRWLTVIGRVREMIRETEARVVAQRSTQIGNA